MPVYVAIKNPTNHPTPPLLVYTNIKPPQLFNIGQRQNSCARSLPVPCSLLLNNSWHWPQLVGRRAATSETRQGLQRACTVTARQCEAVIRVGGRPGPDSRSMKSAHRAGAPN